MSSRQLEPSEGHSRRRAAVGQEGWPPHRTLGPAPLPPAAAWLPWAFPLRMLLARRRTLQALSITRSLPWRFCICGLNPAPGFQLPLFDKTQLLNSSLSTQSKQAKLAPAGGGWTSVWGPPRPWQGLSWWVSLPVGPCSGTLGPGSPSASHSVGQVLSAAPLGYPRPLLPRSAPQLNCGSPGWRIPAVP